MTLEYIEAELTAIINLKEVPDERRACALYNRGVIRETRGAFDDAEKDYTRVADELKEVPDVIRAYVLHNRGITRANRRAFDDAEKDWTRVADELKEVPDEIRARALFGRGATREIRGAFDDAYKDYTRVADELKEVPDVIRANALVNRGVIRKDRGAFDDAYKDYTRVADELKEVPDETRAKALYNRGVNRETRCAFDGAEKDYTRVVDELKEVSDEMRAMALIGRGGTRIRKTQYKQGINDLDEGLRLKPVNAACWFNASKVLREFFCGTHPATKSGREVDSGRDPEYIKPPPLATAREGFYVAARLWRDSSTSSDFTSNDLLTLCEQVDLPLLQLRLAERLQNVGFNSFGFWGKYAIEVENLKARTDGYRTLVAWIDSDMLPFPEEKRAAILAELELVFGDPEGAADRLGDALDAAEDAGETVSVRDRLLMVRALDGPEAGGFSGASAKEWESASEVVRRLVASGELVEDDQRAAALLLCDGDEHDRTMAEAMCVKDGAAKGMAYLGWWLARERGDSDLADQRLQAALAEDRELSRSRKPGWLLPSEIALPEEPNETEMTKEELEKALERFRIELKRVRTELLHRFERDEMAWVFEELLQTLEPQEPGDADDLARLRDRDEKVAAWLGQEMGEAGPNRYDPHLARQRVWREDRALIYPLNAKRREATPQWLQTEEEKLAGSLETMGLGRPACDELSRSQLIERVAKQLLEQNLANCRMKWLDVIRLLHRQGRLMTEDAVRLTMYGCFQQQVDDGRDDKALLKQVSVQGLAFVSGVSSALVMPGSFNPATIAMVSVAAEKITGVALVQLRRILRSEAANETYGQFMARLEVELADDPDYIRFRDAAIIVLG